MKFAILFSVLGLFLMGCYQPTIIMKTYASVGQNQTSATLDGSSLASTCMASTSTLKSAGSYINRTHPVSDNIVDTGRVLGSAAIGGGTGGAVAGAPGAVVGAGTGAVAGAMLGKDKPKQK